MEAQVQAELDFLCRGAVDVVGLDELRQRLTDFREGKRGPLRVKAGFDPTRPDLHFGHCVLLQKLREFQDLGHRVIFLIGDYTAMVGDPTGQNEMRPSLSREEVLASAETYTEQCFKVLNGPTVEVRRNGEWLSKLSTLDFIGLASKMTLARTMERDDFSKRWAEHRPIFQHELLYPLLQGYDSVALDADVELGGTDQLFNLGVGRDLMPRYGKPAQCVMTVPLLEGTDAKVVDGKIVGKKMSKNSGNYIGVSESPDDMFRKCMQIDDSMISRYVNLLSMMSSFNSDAAFEVALRAPALVLKRSFACEMVTRFHGANAAEKAQDQFRRVYMKGDGLPDEIPEIQVPTNGDSLWIAKALSVAKLVPSTNAGARAITAGWVEADGTHITDDKHQLLKGRRYLLRVGSKTRKFAYVTVT